MKLRRPFALLLIASFGIAVYSAVAKYALGHLSVWQLYALSSVGAAAGFTVAAQGFGAWRTIGAMLKAPKAMGVTALAHVTLLIAFMTSFIAFSLGPVSLSSAIMASRPVIVLAYATVIATFIPKLVTERASRPALVTKAASALCVTLGVAAMALL